MKTNIKVIATSLSLATSVGAVAGMGGLSVQSHLGQPFSGSIIVSGDEARALIASGSVNVSGGIRGSVIKQGEDRVLVRLRSSSPVREPVITFTVSAGRQTREYTAFIDPARYTPKEAPTREESNRGRGEQNMRQNSQRTQQDFIERKKPVAEQRRAASSVSQKTQSSEMAAVKKAAKVSVSSRRHRAHAGEKLANIVERYRPRNMSQQTAMRALMLANPSAFKHGTTIRRNVTLYIPTESQWHAYAQRAQKQAMKERVKQVRQTSPVISQNNVTVPVEPDVLPENNKVATKPQAPVAVENQNSPVTPPVASEVKPAAPAVKPEVKTASPEVKASEPVSTAPNNTESAPASSATAQSGSQVVQNSASGTASASPVVAASSVSETVAPPVEQPQPMPPQPVVESEPIEEETDYMPFLLGGLGLLTVGSLGYLAMRRRKKPAVVAIDDEEWTSVDEPAGKSNSKKDVWDEDFSSSLSATRSVASAGATVIDDEPYFDDFDAGNKAKSVSSQTQAAKDEFSLDNFDNFETFDDSFANNSNQAKNNQQTNDDFAWSVSEEKNAPATQANNDFVVADEEDWSLDKLDAISNTPSKKAAEQSFSLDDFVVDDIKPAVAAAATVATAAVATTAAQSFDDNFDFSDFTADDGNKKEETFLVSNTHDDSGFDDFVVADDIVTEVQAAPAVDAKEFDDFAAFDADFAPVSEPVIQAAPASAASEDVAFNLDTFDDFIVAEPVAETAPIAAPSFDDFAAFDADLPKVESPATSQTAAAVEEDLSFGLDAFDDFVLPESETAEVSAPVADNNMLFDDFASFNHDAETPSVVADAIVSPTPVITDTEDDLLGIDDFVVADVKETNVVADDTSALFDNTFATFEETTPQVDAPAAILETFDDTAAFASFETSSPKIDAVAETRAAPTLEDDDLSFGLAAFDDFVVEEETAKPTLTTSENEFALFEPAVDENVAAIQATPAVENNLAFDVAAFDDFTVPAALENETVAATIEPVVLNDIVVDNFDLASEIDAAVAPITPSIVETPVSFDAPIIEEPTISLDAPIVADGFDDLSFDVVDLTAEVPKSITSVGMVDLATGPLEQISSLDNVNLDSLEVIEDVQGWQQDGNANAGFVSGAVSDMTEPLEAKFELAKMYLEIDDAVAARETLRELISESSGAIQEQAKQLLAELGG